MRIGITAGTIVTVSADRNHTYINMLSKKRELCKKEFAKDAGNKTFLKK